ncbi:MAG: YdcF family protein [Pseudomonadota bacterium]|nr:YdcF family protein [Pseudomonadota bacterium]
MLRRILSLILLAWLLGFIAFALLLAQPAGPVKTDAVVVLTGGAGRVDRGIEALRQGWAPQLLVSGVSREVKPGEFAAQFKVSPEQMACCVSLGFAATDTESNARETAIWMREHKVTRIRLVTSDWHMRRAVFELRHAMPRGVSIVEDAVPTHPTMRILFTEYHKLIARWIVQLVTG